MFPALVRHDPGSTIGRRRRIPGLRTAKTTLAAVVAYLLATRVHTSEQPVLASLTALLVVQLTLYKTVRHGADRVLSVVAGVLVAAGVASLTGLTWWSLGAVVALSLVVGRLLRLGPFLLEAPISAMLVLAASGLGDHAPHADGAAQLAALGRVTETLLGAAVGVVVNLVVAPPLHIQPAADATAGLVLRISGFARDMAVALRGSWTRADADRFLDAARRLGTEVARVDRHLERTEESARLNPRGRLAREAWPRLRVALTGLEHCYVTLRNLCRAVLDRTYSVSEDDSAGAYTPRARAALADVLEGFADAVETVPVHPDGPHRAATDDFAELLARRDELATLLMVEPAVDAAAWEQHGALLAAIDRLRVEVVAAARPARPVSRPRPLTVRDRAAVRRTLRELSGAQGPAREPATAPAARGRPPFRWGYGAARRGTPRRGAPRSGRACP